MNVVYDIDNWDEEAVIATIGFFDGVHPGHRYLLEEMRKLADKHHLPSAVITFPTHPRVVLHSDYQPKLLNSFDEKIGLLAKTGVDNVIIMDFTPEMVALTAREFIIDILSTKLHVKKLLIGYDHRFGFQRLEGFEQYVVYGNECGMDVVKASSFSEKGQAISSTIVRNLILRGDVATASQILDYPYHLKGHVVEGQKVGRSIGFPTANIAVDEQFKVIPFSGSYVIKILVDGKQYNGMLYIGPRPTLNDGEDISIEANIFDFSDDIYGKKVTVEFVDFIREDMKFDSLAELTEQMHIDKAKAIEILGK